MTSEGQSSLRLTNNDKRREYYKKYYQEHKEYFKEKNKTSYKKEYYRKYYQDNKYKNNIKKPPNIIKITHEKIIVRFD